MFSWPVQGSLSARDTRQTQKPSHFPTGCSSSTTPSKWCEKPRAQRKDFISLWPFTLPIFSNQIGNPEPPFLRFAIGWKGATSGPSEGIGCFFRTDPSTTQLAQFPRLAHVTSFCCACMLVFPFKKLHPGNLKYVRVVLQKKIKQRLHLLYTQEMYVVRDNHGIIALRHYRSKKPLSQRPTLDSWIEPSGRSKALTDAKA